MAKAYDYIIVGGGSAGLVAAAGLVDAGAEVLLLERGGARTNPIMHFPAGYMKFLAKDTYLAMQQTEPQPQLDGRGPIVPQGKVLGGGSAVNAMVYMRGQPADYEDWNAALRGAGNSDPGWGWDALLPHYVAQEDNDSLGGAAHGTSGPLKVSHLGHTSEMTRAYMKTLQDMGIPYTPDFNDGTLHGVGLMQHTLDWKTRRRCSADDAFLKPRRGAANLTVITGALVDKIVFEGSRATGVAYRRGRVVETVHGREVLLAAGAYQTPKLLMLSGIGGEAALEPHGIATRIALPGVGENLQDHYECPVVATTNGAYGYYGQDRGLKMLKAGIQYLLFKSGPVTTTGVETCAFLDPRGDNTRPTIQMFCVPTVYLDRDVMGADPGHGVTINSLLLRPKSRGRVRLRSADPDAMPVVDTQIFAEQEDLDRTIEGLRFARTILDATPMRELIEREIFPGADVTSDEALATHCRRTVKTGYHPVGTARMGHDADPMAVLDADLRVRGTEGLRVIDASLMPNIVSGNTNAAVMASASRAVERILAAPQRRNTEPA